MAKTHLIVLFDCSSSMSEPFHATATEIRGADYFGTSEIKIDVAKEQLISRLKKSDFEFVTIIPFNSYALSPFTRELPKYQSEIENFIKGIQPEGNTNFAKAIYDAIIIGNNFEKDKEFTYIRHLAITDGLSSTPEKDIELVGYLSENQGIDIILIDPTTEGENHLRKLCKRGHLFTVASASQLRKSLENQADKYSNRIQLTNSFTSLSEKGVRLKQELGILSEGVYSYARESEQFLSLISQAFNKAKNILNETNQINKSTKEHILNHEFPIEKAQNELLEITNSIEKIEKLVDSVKSFIHQSPQNYKISLSHPKLLSKRYPSPFIVKIYPQQKREEVIKQLEFEIENWTGKLVELNRDAKIISGITIIIQINSSDIEFSDKITKYMEDNINTVNFIGKPKDSCYPGDHIAILSISDEKTNRQIQSIHFSLKVVDFAIDHISRPTLSKISSALLALGSLITFILTLIGKIDQTLGISFGTIVGTFSMLIFNRFLNLFRLTRSSVNESSGL